MFPTIGFQIITERKVHLKIHHALEGLVIQQTL